MVLLPTPDGPLMTISRPEPPVVSAESFAGGVVEGMADPPGSEFS